MIQEFEQWWDEYTKLHGFAAEPSFIECAKSWAESAWKESAKRSIASRIKITHVQGTVGTQAIPVTRLEEF